MKRKTLILSFYSLLIFLTIGMVSCEKPIIDEKTGNEIPAEANVILHFTQYEWTEQREPFELARRWPSRDGQRRSQQEAFTRAALPSLQGEGSGVGSVTRSATDITELCSRLNIALFDADGTKVKTVAQKEGDANYGTVALSLAAGTYRLVVIAHNGEGSATITSEEKVTFPNNKVTDTFYYYGDLVVTSEKQNYDLTLTRAVAMFRLVLTDESIPSTVAKMKFYYLGGSSTFSPKDGYGCVNSKQTEIRPVPADFVSGTTFEIYTLPHTEDDVLTKLTVTALDGNDNIIKEKVFEDIPVTRNKVTRYTGSFFGNSGGKTGSGDFRMTAAPDWDAVNSFTF